MIKTFFYRGAVFSVVVLSLASGFFLLLREVAPFKYTNRETNDFGCGEIKMLTKEIKGKEQKHIYLVENLVKATPHLGCRMWATYELIAKIALDIYAQDNPQYQPVIHFFNEQAPELDPLRPATILETVAESPALIAVGFAWSSMAGIAAQRASQLKMPYVSPTGVIKSINEGEYSVSLGTPVSSIGAEFTNLIKQLGSEKLILVENTSQIHEREYADAIRKNFSGTIITIQYQGDFPENKVLETISDEKSRLLVVIPGYAALKSNVVSILSSYPSTAFLVGPQWSHDHKLLDLKGEIYCISDYYNFLDTPLHSLVTKKWYELGGEEIIGGYLFSLFDALYFSLKALEAPKNREEVRLKIKNSAIEGAKGFTRIENGLIEKNIYILRYEYKEGFRLLSGAL